jgi:hypothetical protein
VARQFRTSLYRHGLRMMSPPPPSTGLLFRDEFATVIGGGGGVQLRRELTPRSKQMAYHPYPASAFDAARE